MMQDTSEPALVGSHLMAVPAADASDRPSHDQSAPHGVTRRRLTSRERSHSSDSSLSDSSFKSCQSPSSLQDKLRLSPRHQPISKPEISTSKPRPLTQLNGCGPIGSESQMSGSSQGHELRKCEMLRNLAFDRVKPSGE